MDNIELVSSFFHQLIMVQEMCVYQESNERCMADEWHPRAMQPSFRSLPIIKLNLFLAHSHAV